MKKFYLISIILCVIICFGCDKKVNDYSPEEYTKVSFNHLHELELKKDVNYKITLDSFWEDKNKFDLTITQIPEGSELINEDGKDILIWTPKKIGKYIVVKENKFKYFKETMEITVK
jgi:hypothetical protein